MEDEPRWVCQSSLGLFCVQLNLEKIQHFFIFSFEYSLQKKSEAECLKKKLCYTKRPRLVCSQM
jgi:hypothetical protein